MKRMLFKVLEHVVPKRILVALDDRKVKRALAESKLVSAQSRQFQLEVDIYRRGIEKRRHRS